MKTILILLIVATASFASAGLDSEILPKNQVILNGSWNPTVDEISKALKAAGKFLENPKNESEWQKKEIEKILTNSSKYCVQFSCEIVDDKKIIRCNFLPVEKDSTPWKKGWIEVFDGGFWYWRIDYDVKSGQCMNFSSNGYA